jgi:hypothetical protein
MDVATKFLVSEKGLAQWWDYLPAYLIEYHGTYSFCYDITRFYNIRNAYFISSHIGLENIFATII